MIARAIRLLSALAALSLTTLALGGDLDPPGAPAPTPGPEPRIAVNAENTPGDADSVYRITEGGSYYLTGDVTGEVGKSGIVIATSDVILDLNGFSVAGVAGAYDGILVAGTWYGLSIHGGLVWGWPDDGVDAGGAVRSRVANITSTNNTVSGITVGPRSLIEGCLVDNNTGDGLVVGVTCVVSDCLANSNGGDGIVADVRCTIRDCTSSLNTGDGIVVNGRSRVSRCHSVDNTSVGITVEGDSNRIEDNSVVDNGGWGIDTALFVAENIIIGNSVIGNGGGIYLSDSATDNFVGHNVVSNNTGNGILNDNSANEIFGNVAIGNTINFSGAGLVVGSPSTSTGPWANLSR